MVAGGAPTEPRNADTDIGVRTRRWRHVDRALRHHGPLTDWDRGAAPCGSAAADASLRVLAHERRGDVGTERGRGVVGLAADIAHLEHQVFAELALHRQAPLLDGGRVDVRINACRGVGRTVGAPAAAAVPQVGGSAADFWSGYVPRSPFNGVNCSRAFTGGLGCSRIPRLLIRSLWIPKPARTAHVPVRVGSQARPTRGCNSSLAWLVSKHESATTGSVDIK